MQLLAGSGRASPGNYKRSQGGLLSKIIISVEVNADFKNHLQRLARSEGKTLSNFCRGLLSEALLWRRAKEEKMRLVRLREGYRLRRAGKNKAKEVRSESKTA